MTLTHQKASFQPLQLKKKNNNQQNNLSGEVTSPQTALELLANPENEQCEQIAEEKYENLEHNPNGSFIQEVKTHSRSLFSRNEASDNPTPFTFQHQRNDRVGSSGIPISSPQTRPRRFDTECEQDFETETPCTVYPKDYVPKISEIGKFLNLQPLRTNIRNPERLKGKIDDTDKDFVHPVGQPKTFQPLSNSLKRETQKNVAFDLFSFNQSFFWTKGEIKQSSAC